jgi:CubicO group peptidase (beta-lactamase class C family)
VAKSFVATLIAVAMQEGRIESLDQTVEEFAPQFAGSAYGEISLRHLLMMSTGLDFAEIYAESGESDIRPFFFNAFIMRRDVDEMASEIESKRGPGEELDYVSPNTHVLSAVVRGIYDQPIAQIVEEKLWTPLGMADDASWLQNRPGDDGMAIGYCCLQATLQDYARMGQFYLQDGVWNGERILPEGWVNQATTPNSPFQEPNATYDLRGYGLHFWIPENTQGEFFMAGVYGQYVWVDLERDIVIARTAGDAAWGARTAESFAVFRSLAETFAVEDPAPVETEDAE